jgi:DNA mismatch repair protein MutL
MPRLIGNGARSGSTVPLPRIRRLDPQLAARIAAGEVVERPASVVKELLENALDAGARSVRVELSGGGLDHIRIIDDGTGIAADELELAFERHATSKLAALEDLERISTLGFRGEALPSIAAVARVSVRTRRAVDTVGAGITVAFGDVIGRQSLGLPAGTTIDVMDLFESLPARRKFLKGRQAESSAAHAVVQQYALANADIAMTLVNDGQTVFSTVGAVGLRDVIACLYGLEAQENLVELQSDRHGIRVRGYVSRIGYTRATRSHQSFFVNGRWVRNRVLNVALAEGYHSMLMGGRHPVAVVLLELPADEIDVNVHPAKTEIRFLRERDVFGAIRHGVNQAVAVEQSIVRPELAATDALIEQLVQLPLLGSQAAPDPRTAGIAAPARAFPTLRVLGQAGSLFIIAEGPDGVYMVDQHAAHERVLYDDLVAEMASNDVASQPLLEPALVELGASEMDALVQCAALVQCLGFDIQPFGDSTCLVRALPAMLSGAPAADTLQALLSDLAAGKDQGDLRDRSLATVACKAAVKAGQTLSLEEMRFLVQRLERTSQPKTCPHGRPTMILLSTTALERQFGRR